MSEPFRVEVKGQGFEGLDKALVIAPRKAFVFLKREMGRFGARFRKRFINERLRGGGGIRWDEGKKKIGGNVRYMVNGGALPDLSFEARISRFLRYHEEGATINPNGAVTVRLQPGLSPRPGQMAARLFPLRGTHLLAMKDDAGAIRPLYLLVQRPIKVPPRLGFQPMFQREVNRDLIPQLQKELTRAVDLALKEELGKLGNSLK